MVRNTYEMRFGGTGGQGMMLLGDVYAKAAGIFEGKEVVLLKSYGPEARGGACRSELIASDSPIDYPVLTKPDFVLAMSQLACDSYSADMNAETGVLLVDSGFVNRLPENIKNIYSIPITDIAVEKTGKSITANVVALGAISVLSPAAEPENVKKSVLLRFPEKLHAINIAAFEAGVSAARKLT